jgi:hypothetical protein
MDWSWVPVLGPPATVGGAAVVLWGVLRTISSNETLRREDRAAEERRALAEHLHDDERAPIAIRQAIRDRDHERVRALAEGVMTTILATRQAHVGEDGQAAVDNLQGLVDSVLPGLELERDSEALITSIWALRHAAIWFRAAQGGPQAIRHGDVLEQRRDELAQALEVATRECKALVARYARPVVDEG